ncbi:Serpin family [Trema orientale]|uniref:Serpin family n=1 Tax=Trema orientale TaxID=63057 RepID=A0A2P5EUE1_TREOI|nr:Serpin family [Trema orientale]
MELSMQIALVDQQTKNLGKNFIFSPLSLTTLLSMVASGLKGETLEQLMSLLGLKSLADLITESCRLVAMATSENDEGPLLFSSANGAWVDKKYKLKPSFQQVLRTIYKADSFTLDFGNKLEEALKEIDSWVENSTKGLIKKSVPKQFVRNDTVLILANALYFKGTWARPFHPFYTKSKNFYTLDGNVVEVPFMHEFCRIYSYGTSQGFKIIRLPYKDGSQKGLRFSMYIFLPDEKDGLPDLLKQLSSDSALLNLEFEFEEERIREVAIPKFKFMYSIEVSDIMEQMGLRLNIKENAEMLEDLNPNAIIEDMKVCHTCCIEVNERGTEAAAVSLSLVGGGGPPPTEFIADHPFMFMIREDFSETPIFLGAVVNPLLA